MSQTKQTFDYKQTKGRRAIQLLYWLLVCLQTAFITAIIMTTGGFVHAPVNETSFDISSSSSSSPSSWPQEASFTDLWTKPLLIYLHHHHHHHHHDQRNVGACDGSRYYQLAKHVPFVFANLRDSYIWRGIIVISSFVFVTSCLWVNSSEIGYGDNCICGFVVSWVVAWVVC